MIPTVLSTCGFTVAIRGRPADYSIVRPVKASPSQLYAAAELQKFIEEMTGVKLPVITDDGPLPERAVLLGDTLHTAGVLGAAVDVASLGDDGFRIVTRAPHVLIIGGSVRGTLYGVYEALECFGGCRWYASWHSVIPKQDRFSVPVVDETQKPAFAVREPWWFDLRDGDFAARSKVNGNRARLIEKHGGKNRFGLFGHSFRQLCPCDEFFDAHPEYFSEIEGKRVKDDTQLCLTHPDVLQIVTERLFARIRQDPAAKLWSVSQNDNKNFCTCPACKAVDDHEGSSSGTLIRFINQVAGAVEKEFPDVVIVTFAYQYTRKPPKTLRPHRNVMPWLCDGECEFSFPIAQSGKSEENLRFMEDLQGWSRISDKLYVWDYTTNFRHFVAPFPNVKALQGNVRLFRDHRVTGLLEQGDQQGRHADFAELKVWLLAKWLWNPDLPQEALLQDFFKGYYGAAAPFVRQYFDEVHTFYNDPEKKPLTIWDHVLNKTIPDEFYVRATHLWQQAENAVKDSPAHAYNVRMGMFPVLYVRYNRLPVFKNVSDASQEHRALAAELLARCNEAGNIKLSENDKFHTEMLGVWKSLCKEKNEPLHSNTAL